MPSASPKGVDTASQSWLVVSNTEGVTGYCYFVCRTVGKLGPVSLFPTVTDLFISSTHIRYKRFLRQ